MRRSARLPSPLSPSSQSQMPSNCVDLMIARNFPALPGQTDPFSSTSSHWLLSAYQRHMICSSFKHGNSITVSINNHEMHYHFSICEDFNEETFVTAGLLAGNQIECRILFFPKSEIHDETPLVHHGFHEFDKHKFWLIYESVFREWPGILCAYDTNLFLMLLSSLFQNSRYFVQFMRAYFLIFAFGQMCFSINNGPILWNVNSCFVHFLRTLLPDFLIYDALFWMASSLLFSFFHSM